MRPDEILGKTVLVGLTYAAADGTVREQRQLHGVVVTADEERGIEILQPSGEIFALPPAFDSFESADAGEYTLRSTGEVITDPDLLCSWTITSPPSTLDEWMDSYSERRGVYEEFAERLRGLLRQLLKQRGLDVSWAITFETGESELRRELLETWRDTGTLEDPLDSRQRTVGVTIGLVSTNDLRELEELVEAEFRVDPDGSVTWAERGRDTEGSISADFPSYLVELDERRAGLAEWARYAGLKLRIEAATDISDGWRLTLNKLPLRHAASYPSEIRDLLAGRAAAAVEADADIAFAHDSLERLLDEYRETITGGDLELPLDAVTLLAYLHVSEPIESLVRAAADGGFQHDPDDWPAWTSVEDGPLWLLGRDGVASIAEIDAFLREVMPRAPEMLAQLRELSTERGFTPWALRESLLEFVWLVFRRADAGTVTLADYRDAIEYALNTLIGNPVAASEQGA